MLVESKKHKNYIGGKRSLARLIAVQALYQYDFKKRQGDIIEIAEELVDNYTFDLEGKNIKSYRKKTDMSLLRDLVSGSSLVLEKLDLEIQKSLSGKNKFSDIDDVMLQILRVGVFELKFIKDNPTNTVINEYVDIAGSFYEVPKVSFVNAVLDKVAKSL